MPNTRLLHRFRLMGWTDGAWLAWMIVAFALTFAFAILILYRVVTDGELAVDAALGQRVTRPMGLVLIGVWVPLLIHAWLADRAARRSADHP